MPEFYKNNGSISQDESETAKVTRLFKQQASKYMSDQELTDLAAGIILEGRNTLGPEDADLIQSLVVSVIGLPRLG